MIKAFRYEEDAAEIKRWGDKFKFPLPDAQFLPDVGLIANDAAVGFLYMTNSSLGWIEWVFANPDKSVEERKEALDLVMRALEQVAIVRGLKAIFSAAGTKAYASILDRNGFKETDKSMIHYTKILGGKS